MANMCRSRIINCVTRILAVAACLLAALPMSASAQMIGSVRPPFEAQIPDFVGGTGLLLVSSAYVQPDQNIDAFVVDDSRGLSGGLLAGLANRIELGVTQDRLNSQSTRTFGTFKLNLVREQLLAPAFSAGMIQPLSGRLGQTTYVVMSKTVIPYFVDALTGQKNLAVKIHVGYGSGLYANTPFVGGELAGSNGLSGIGEVVHGRANVGARYDRNGLAATIACLDWKTTVVSLGYLLELR